MQGILSVMRPQGAQYPKLEKNKNLPKYGKLLAARTKHQATKKTLDAQKRRSASNEDET